MIFTRGEYGLGTLDPVGDAELLHGWVTHPKAAYWMMQGASVDDVAAEYQRIHDHRYHDAFLGYFKSEPTFLAERYDPAHCELVGIFDASPGDVGMHFLCAPTDTPVHGFSLGVITTVMAWLFADEATRRVVVEPDVRNTAVHALNAAVGFTVLGPVVKPEKEALLSICTRAAFEAAVLV